MASSEPVTIPMLQQMKREGKKSVGVVAWDYQIARIADRAGVDFVSINVGMDMNPTVQVMRVIAGFRARLQAHADRSTEREGPGEARRRQR